MRDDAALLEELAQIAAETDQLRTRASESLCNAVGRAVDRGLTQTQIARAIGRSQPEVSRLVKAYRSRSFRPTSALGKLLVEHRMEILELAQTHRASNVRVFGSVARGDDDEASDIDLLVDLDPHADLLDLAALDVELERLLQRRVDLVPARMLKRRFAESALAEAVAL